MKKKDMKKKEEDKERIFEDQNNFFNLYKVSF